MPDEVRSFLESYPPEFKNWRWPRGGWCGGSSPRPKRRSSVPGRRSAYGGQEVLCHLALQVMGQPSLPPGRVTSRPRRPSRGHGEERASRRGCFSSGLPAPPSRGARSGGFARGAVARLFRCLVVCAPGPGEPHAAERATPLTAAAPACGGLAGHSRPGGRIAAGARVVSGPRIEAVREDSSWCCGWAARPVARGVVVVLRTFARATSSRAQRCSSQSRSLLAYSHGRGAAHGVVCSPVQSR
jgi:hypothetical protein